LPAGLDRLLRDQASARAALLPEPQIALVVALGLRALAGHFLDAHFGFLDGELHLIGAEPRQLLSRRHRLALLDQHREHRLGALGHHVHDVERFDVRGRLQAPLDHAARDRLHAHEQRILGRPDRRGRGAVGAGAAVHGGFRLLLRGVV